MANHKIEVNPICLNFSDLSRSKHIQHSNDDCVRLYKSSPSGITLQIRAITPLATERNPYGHGMAKRHMMASAIISRDQAKAIIEALQAEVARIDGDETGSVQQAAIQAALCR